MFKRIDHVAFTVKDRAKSIDSKSNYGTCGVGLQWKYGPPSQLTPLPIRCQKLQ